MSTDSEPKISDTTTRDEYSSTSKTLRPCDQCRQSAEYVIDDNYGEMFACGVCLDDFDGAYGLRQYLISRQRRQVSSR